MVLHTRGRLGVELADVLAQPASIADFAHGPRAVVEDGFPVLGVAITLARAADPDAPRGLATVMMTR